MTRRSQWQPRTRRGRSGSLLGAGTLLALLSAVLTACATATTPPSPSMDPGPFPDPLCGGIEIAIDRALPCDRVAAIALDALRAQAPHELARGVTRIDVSLGPCPRGEVPPQIDCTGDDFAQLVTVHFGPPLAEVSPDSLTVGVGPVSGRVLGISNPLIL